MGMTSKQKAAAAILNYLSTTVDDLPLVNGCRFSRGESTSFTECLVYKDNAGSITVELTAAGDLAAHVKTVSGQSIRYTLTEPAVSNEVLYSIRTKLNSAISRQSGPTIVDVLDNALQHCKDNP